MFIPGTAAHASSTSAFTCATDFSSLKTSFATQILLDLYTNSVELVIPDSAVDNAPLSEESDVPKNAVDSRLSVPVNINTFDLVA